MMVKMKQNTIITIAIILTTALALTTFIIHDHTGFTVTEHNLEQNENESILTYTLLVGREFNHLDCRYNIIDDDKIIESGNTTLLNTTVGSYNITENITNTNFEKVEIIVYEEITYEENNTNKTKMQEAYNTTFNV